LLASDTATAVLTELGFVGHWCRDDSGLARLQYFELARRVRAGKMSAHAAAVVVGWRSRPPKYLRTRPLSVEALIA
jgi:hypothetical protein